DRFDDLAAILRDESLEGLDPDNTHRFLNELLEKIPAEKRPELSDETLLEYDRNIVRHTLAINENRLCAGEDAIVWKYFQYLALLFTEIYLDRYFTDPYALRAAINERISAFNESAEEADRIEPLDETDDPEHQLNKIAFWMATGSGKTLLMHVHIQQYRHYLARAGREHELNRTILLTPNEGLSEQHRLEFAKSGLTAEIFQKDGGGLFSGQSIEILDIHKLREESGDKTVAVEAFEGNNLVLVDEGHRGASGGEAGKWLSRRDDLCEKGFSFEYSATFGHAVEGDANLSERYAKAVLFDYSYRWFYGDGFGKDYQILNLDTDTEREHLDLYLTACLLVYYQQLRFHDDHRDALTPFAIEKPLWIFVGGSVTKTLAARDASDIVSILQFLERFVTGGEETTARIGRVLSEGLTTADGRNIFAKRFQYLGGLGMDADEIYRDVLARIFHSPGGGRLHIENLKGAQGEIALRLGAESDPFGVVNVGDDAKLVKLCEKEGFLVMEREFSGSLFHQINAADSPVNLLIGSKKFTEGWNSYRVATMGLMNVGRTEGAQIIQLFGRGVRLRGYNRSLKRSARTPLPEEIEPPKHMRLVETLSIFGIRADYMEQFRKYLEAEGLPANEDRIEFILPVIRNLGKPLRTIRLKEKINGVKTGFGDAFRKLGPVPTLDEPEDYLQRNKVVVNWYPKIKAMRSAGVDEAEETAPDRGILTERHVAWLDIDRIFFEIERLKAERGWYNYNLRRSAIRDLLFEDSWYTLYIPEDLLKLDSFEKRRIWQEIATTLIRKYVERYYTYRKREWELPHLEYRELDEEDPNLLPDEEGDGGYRILIEASREDIVRKLETLKSDIEKGRMKDVEFAGLKAIWFGNHLYQPLLYLKGSEIEVRPEALNEGESRFVTDLRAYHDAHPD
ncbi:MAG: DEAD/DEAH box helicase, partial [Candidatus Hydrogenedentota bacterium]